MSPPAFVYYLLQSSFSIMPVMRGCILYKVQSRHHLTQMNGTVPVSVNHDGPLPL